MPITKLTLQFEGCFTLTDYDISKIIDMLNDRYSGGHFSVADQKSVCGCWHCDRCERD